MATTTKKTRKTTTRRTQPVTISAEQFGKMTVIQQLRRAFARGARLAAVVGFSVGSLFPVLSFVLIHHEVSEHPISWVFVVGALIMSFSSVYNWFTAAYSSKVKGFGCALALEGVMTFCHIFWLSIICLSVLVFVNAVSSACAFQIRKEID